MIYSLSFCKNETQVQEFPQGFSLRLLQTGTNNRRPQTGEIVSIWYTSKVSTK